MTACQTCQTELPNDAKTLRAMILQLLDSLEEERRRNRELQHQLDWLRRRQFGRKSETLDQAQLMLFAELLKQEPAAVPQVDKPSPDSPKSDKAGDGQDSKRGHGRRPLPEHLPRKRIEYHPPQSQRVCSGCQKPMAVMGEEVTEELEYIPASLLVLEHVRVKYACRGCQEKVAIGELPARPIEKGRPGPGLLAHILTSKYSDHLPLHRLEGILARHGVNIRRSTLCDWVADMADLLAPIVREMVRSVLASYKIHTDDTPVPVQEEGRTETRKGYLWVYVGDNGHIVFDYTPTRCRDGPLRFLGDYHGYVQADAYNGYDEFFANGQATEVGCWAHARRKFYDARSTDELRSQEMLALVKLLYQVEKEAREHKLDAGARRALRQEKSSPILERIENRLEAWSLEVLPRSPVGQAVAYARGQWEALTEYVDDGHLEIDNNAAERALRCVAVGRKNWMFAGSDAGGERAAVIYSLVASCRACGIDPFAYLRDVIERISTHPASRIAELTPAGWKQARQADGQ